MGSDMDYDLVIKNGTVVTREATFISDVAVQGGTIAAVEPNLRGKKEIDATGKLVTPGAVDIHVHLQMPIGNFVSADDFYTGTRAAAFGGTTAIVDFIEPRDFARVIHETEWVRLAPVDGQFLGIGSHAIAGLW
jgi:dihydropyrimidinase